MTTNNNADDGSFVVIDEEDTEIFLRKQKIKEQVSSKSFIPQILEEKQTKH